MAPTTSQRPHDLLRLPYQGPVERFKDTSVTTGWWSPWDIILTPSWWVVVLLWHKSGWKLDYSCSIGTSNSGQVYSSTSTSCYASCRSCKPQRQHNNSCGSVPTTTTIPDLGHIITTFCCTVLCFTIRATPIPVSSQPHAVQQKLNAPIPAAADFDLAQCDLKFCR